MGKGTVLSRVREVRPDLGLTVSATTRKPRPGEVDGVAYHFLTDEEFDRELASGNFLEWANVHGHRYGTLRREVTSRIESGQSLVLEIDVQGAFQVKEKMPEAHLVFIDAPSIEVIEQRLRGRGTESEDVIAARMQTALVELSQKEKYDYVLVNDDLDRATDELLSYIDQQA